MSMKMDGVLGGLGCNLRLSGMVADSIMMGIVNSAMDQAFSKACSKEGIIERLNEKSRFCELAVMQLDWCLKFVQEETDKFVLIETNRERQKLVSDLSETRDRIQRRLHETEYAIWDKDRELSEICQSELKLRRALVGRGGNVGSKDGDFCELKNSVDQQFFNIKQKIADEHLNLTSGMRKIMSLQEMKTNVVDEWDEETESQLMVQEGDYNCDGDRDIQYQAEEDPEVEPQHHLLRREFSAGLEKMRSDIDILKETLDVAFGMMSNAIALAEVGPMEQQWRWVVEKDIVALVFRGFLMEIQEDSKVKVKGGSNKCGPRVSLDENWSQLMDEIASLRNELDQLVIQTEDRAKNVTSRDSIPTPPIKNVGGSAAKEKPSSDEPDLSLVKDTCVKSENSSTKAEEEDHPEDPSKENSAGQGSLVAEMIRNHESIIRQKSEELNWLKGEILRERGSSAMKKDKGSDTMRKRIQNLISRLDSVINEKAKVDLNFDHDCTCVHENDLMRGVSVQEVGKLKEEQDDLNLMNVMMNDIYTILFINLVEDLHSKLQSDDTMNTIREDSPSYNQFQYYESLIKEDVQKIVLRGMVQEWENFSERTNIESLIKEEVYHMVLRDAVRNINDAHSFTPTEVQSVKIEGKLQEHSSCNHTEVEKLEYIIQDDVHIAFFREMVKEWKKEIESHFNPFVRNEENFQNVFPSNSILPRLQSSQKDNLLRTLESLSNSLEVEETSMFSASLKLIERNAHIELSDPEHEKRNDKGVHHKGILNTKNEDLSPVVSNLKIAMQHITISKVQLKELRSCLGLSVGDIDGGCGQMSSVEMDVEGSKDSRDFIGNKKEFLRDPAPSVFSNCTNILKAIMDFEFTVNERIGLTLSRLEQLERELDFSVEHVSSIRKKELMYRKAFLSRCCNLQKAEAEVDLLADELDDLHILVETIYIALDHYSPVLHHYYGIDDILKLIKKELKRPFAPFSQSSPS